MNSEQQLIVRRLQDNLYTIRQLAGWSAEELANLLDVTKQTIYNIEREGAKTITWVQYLAIRRIIESEIEQQPDNVVLPQAVAVLLDNEELSAEEMKELQISLRTIAKGMARSTDKGIASKLIMQTIGAATAGLAAGVLTRSPGAGINTWLTIARAMWLTKGAENAKKR